MLVTRAFCRCRKGSLRCTQWPRHHIGPQLSFPSDWRFSLDLKKPPTFIRSEPLPPDAQASTLHQLRHLGQNAYISEADITSKSTEISGNKVQLTFKIISDRASEGKSSLGQSCLKNGQWPSMVVERERETPRRYPREMVKRDYQNARLGCKSQTD